MCVNPLPNMEVITVVISGEEHSLKALELLGMEAAAWLPLLLLHGHRIAVKILV